MAFKWLEKLTQLGGSATEKENERDDLSITLAVLMLEIARSDFSESDSETKKMEQWLKSQNSGLGGGDINQLLTAARDLQAHSAGLFEYTRRACEQLSMEERVELVKQFWQIAYADGVIDKYEEAAIRKASDLLYVDHADFIRAKLAAQASSQHDET